MSKQTHLRYHVVTSASNAPMTLLRGTCNQAVRFILGASESPYHTRPTDLFGSLYLRNTRRHTFAENIINATDPSYYPLGVCPITKQLHRNQNPSILRFVSSKEYAVCCPKPSIQPFCPLLLFKDYTLSSQPHPCGAVLTQCCAI